MPQVQSNRSIEPIPITVSRGEQEAPIAGHDVYKMDGATSGKIITDGNRYESWVGGTGAGGEYIIPHCRSSDGRVLPPRPNMNIRIIEVDDLARLLELSATESPTVFTRPGFSGHYIVQRETDGTLSVYYGGGKHISGKPCSIQTFHHGQWDLNRLYPTQLTVELNTPRPSSLPSLVEPPREHEVPLSSAEREKLPGMSQAIAVKVPEEPLFKAELKWPSQIRTDYHISDAYNRERNNLRSVSQTAGAVLPAEVRDTLEAEFAGAPVEMATDESQRLFNRTVNLVNNEAAQYSSISPADDALRTKLGMPRGTRVFVARAGDLGFNEEQLHGEFDRAFGDMIRIRGFQPPLVHSSDVVVFQAFRNNNSGPTFLRMSIVEGGEQRENWQVTSYEATHQSYPERYISSSIHRNITPTVVPMQDWQQANRHWFTPGTSRATELERAFKEKIDMNVAARKASEGEEAARKQREVEAAKQSEQFVKVSDRHYRSMFEGTAISQFYNTHASMRAAETRTGTFTVNAEALMDFQTTAPDGSKKDWHINKLEDITKLSATDKRMFEHALTTPMQGDPELSIRRIVDLFPSDVYRPNSVVGVFYSPRFYRQELLGALAAQYPDGNVATQRTWLTKLYREMQSRGKITEGVVGELPGVMK